jgi:ABC-type lipoprotein export system ATPase subunit
MESATKNKIIELINQYKSSTRVIVSNDEAFASTCDQVFVMTEEGKLVKSTNN